MLQKVGPDPRRGLETDLAAQCGMIAQVLLMGETRPALTPYWHSMSKIQVKKGKKTPTYRKQNVNFQIRGGKPEEKHKQCVRKAESQFGIL